MKRTTTCVLLGTAAVLGIGGWTFARAISPPGGGPFYYRVEGRKPLGEALDELEAKGGLRSARATRLLAFLSRRKDTVGTGTYRISGDLEALQNLRALGHPIVQMVRLPETNWAKRSANLLQRAEVCTADDYLALVNRPDDWKEDFPLPPTTLEGYLYPDTYDLPPMLGAKAVVQRQLEAFRTKVWEPLGHPKDLQRILTVASLVQLEAGRGDAAMIAGVIENRLKKRMRLQIDASILYGLGKWRRLTFKDYREVDSPYNLYRHGGLPPTPICSPSIASIRAAMAPARHNYLYYVAMPDGHSLFAATFEEHKRNIKKRLEALKG